MTTIALRRRRRFGLALAPYVFTLGFFLVWEVLCVALKVPAYFLPTPSATLAAMWTYREQLIWHSFHTLWMTLAGFGIAVVFGLFLGVCEQAGAVFGVLYRVAAAGPCAGDRADGDVAITHPYQDFRAGADDGKARQIEEIEKR